ncbi:MAG: hypothetical protein H6R10_2545 [Rhodocyclaceae bacterium]|nr:hypothetical protein [Rhodocyclaceae bacterium]
MKQNLILRVSGIAIAMALSALAAPSWAQNDPGSTMDSSDYATRQSSDIPDYMRPLEYRSWGNMPRSSFRNEQEVIGAQGRAGAYGPRGERTQSFKSYFSEPVGNRGELGFLNWRENNTDTP